MDRPTAHGRLYFAYGSNLALSQMRERCPQSVPVAPYALPHHRLEFVGECTRRWGTGGVATVIPFAGASVHGALYRLSAEDEARLDVCEGVSRGQYRKDVELLRCDGEPVLIYIAALDGILPHPPNAKYLAVIRQGYSDWNLPLEVLAGLETFPADP
jgi:hypothetical protein